MAPSHLCLSPFQGASNGSFAGLRLASLRVEPTPAVPRDPVAETVSEVRQRGLERANVLMQDALADSTRGKQQAAARDLCAWLEVYGDGSDARTCTPEDLLIYMMEHYTHHHRGRIRAENLYTDQQVSGCSFVFTLPVEIDPIKSLPEPNTAQTS